jgi:hypothetical protein
MTAQTLPENLAFAETGALDRVSEKERKFGLKRIWSKFFFMEDNVMPFVLD